MFTLIQRAADVAEETVISMISVDATVDLADVVTVADLAVTETEDSAETATVDSVEETVTAVLEERPMLRLSETARLHTENLAEKTNSN